MIADAGKANRAVLRIVNNDPLATPIPWPGTNATSINEPVVLGRFEDGDPVATAGARLLADRRGSEWRN